MYSQLPSIPGGRSSIRNLRTRHAVVKGTHLTWLVYSLLKKINFTVETVTVITVAKVLVSADICEVATRRQLANLPPLSQFLDGFLTKTTSLKITVNNNIICLLPKVYHL
jgi:hypothetical protein